MSKAQLEAESSPAGDLLPEGRESAAFPSEAAHNLREFMDSAGAHGGLSSDSRSSLRKPPPVKFWTIDVGTNCIHLVMAEKV